MPRWLVWAQNWEETERGWGCRPDGYSLHRTKEGPEVLLKEMRDREQQGQATGYVPDEYTRPCGDPFEVIITDQATISLIQETPNLVWGQGRVCPLPPVRGTAHLHIYDVEEALGYDIAPRISPEFLTVSLGVQETLLELGLKGETITSDSLIREAISCGLVETYPPKDPQKHPVALRLSHYGWLWIRQTPRPEVDLR